MKTRASWLVVVIDDREEFAVHVWRYLNRSLGIGSADGRETLSVANGENHVSLDGRFMFRWICADDSWQKRLTLVEGLLESWVPRLLVLVDVNGKPEAGYDYAAVVALLRQWEDRFPKRIDFRVMSAYNVGVTDPKTEVLPKSRDTLRAIRSLLGEELGVRAINEGYRHVLVTGAGFEIRNEQGGFGMPLTHELLKAMGTPFLFQNSDYREGDEAVLALADNGTRFPLPVGRLWKDFEPIQRAANEGKLDRYWDILLFRELSLFQEKIGHLDGPKRAEVAADALLWERRMREAFRKAIREHDWGFMNQSLAAAGLPWLAWLTTNYTRFADRAIDVVPPVAEGGHEKGREWRVISTGSEAGVLSREDSAGKGCNVSVTGEHSRFLFKLHGDIGHLQTMAIAGHDKDAFSPLSMPVDDLYHVYGAAERFLAHTLGETTGVVTWHIVGHALNDHLLLNLIRRARSQIKAEHCFLVADPNPQAPVSKLEEVVNSKNGIESRRLLAEEYMARLARTGLPLVESLADASGWFEKLPLGRLEYSSE